MLPVIATPVVWRQTPPFHVGANPSAGKRRHGLNASKRRIHRRLAPHPCESDGNQQPITPARLNLSRRDAVTTSSFPGFASPTRIANRLIADLCIADHRIAKATTFRCTAVTRIYARAPTRDGVARVVGDFGRKLLQRQFGQRSLFGAIRKQATTQNASSLSSRLCIESMFDFYTREIVMPNV